MFFYVCSLALEHSKPQTMWYNCNKNKHSWDMNETVDEHEWASWSYFKSIDEKQGPCYLLQFCLIILMLRPLWISFCISYLQSNLRNHSSNFGEIFWCGLFKLVPYFFLLNINKVVKLAFLSMIELQVLARGIDCDIALLSVESKEFWKGAEPLHLGHLPRLQV